MIWEQEKELEGKQFLFLCIDDQAFLTDNKYIS